MKTKIVDRGQLLRVFKENIRSYCEDCKNRNAVPYFMKACPNPEEEWQNRLSFAASELETDEFGG